MNRVKTSFSIKNLEHLSGIKATNQIWKKDNLLNLNEQRQTYVSTIWIVYKNSSRFDAI